MPGLDINIHLDSGHEPDPTQGTDFAVIVMIGTFVMFIASFNVLLLYMTRRWIPVLGKNVPLIIIMSLASTVHIVSVFLNNSYFPELTLLVESVSCVLFSFWMEYFLGLATFLCTLALRILTLLLIVVPEMRPASGGEHRKFALKLVFCTFFMLPIFDICLLVSVNHADHPVMMDAASEGFVFGLCETPIKYKIPLICTLLFYMLLLLVMCVILQRTGNDLEQTPIVIDIIKVSVPLLTAGVVLHFAFTLNYWWGRFAFMMIVLALHTFAYSRAVLPGMPAYFCDPNSVERTTEEMEHMMEIARDAHLETVNIDTGTLRRYDNIREDFFQHCIVYSADKVYYYRTHDLRDAYEFGSRTEDEEDGISISLMIDFFREIWVMNKYRKELINCADSHVSGSAEKRGRFKLRFQGQHKRTIMRFTDVAAVGRRKPIPLRNEFRHQLEHGFEDDNPEAWNVDILDNLIDDVLSRLIAEFAMQYYRERDQAIYNMRQESIAKIDQLTAEDYYQSYLKVGDTESALESVPAVIFNTIASGPAETRTAAEEEELQEMNRIPEIQELGPSFGDLPVERQIEIISAHRKRMENSFDTPEPIHLTDGSTIYTNPLRALFAFFIDVAMCIVKSPWSLRDMYHESKGRLRYEFEQSRTEAGDHATLVHEDMPEDF